MYNMKKKYDKVFFIYEKKGLHLSNVYVLSILFIKECYLTCEILKNSANLYFHLRKMFYLSKILEISFFMNEYYNYYFCFYK